MVLIVWLLVGGVIGWLASLIMRTDAQQGMVLNVIVGIVGAAVGGLLFNGGTINQAPLDPSAFLISLLGAVILLAVVNVIRRGSIR